MWIPSAVFKVPSTTSHAAVRAPARRRRRAQGHWHDAQAVDSDGARSPKSRTALLSPQPGAEGRGRRPQCSRLRPFLAWRASSSELHTREAIAQANSCTPLKCDRRLLGRAVTSPPRRWAASGSATASRRAACPSGSGSRSPRRARRRGSPRAGPPRRRRRRS